MIVTVGVTVGVIVTVGVGVGVCVALTQLTKVPIVYVILFTGLGESIESISINVTLSELVIPVYGIYVLLWTSELVIPVYVCDNTLST